MEYYLMGLKKYADFNGRARRKEYWMFLLFNIIFAVVAMVLDNVLGLADPNIGYGVIYGIYALATFIPGLAIAIRRLHDVGKSGWMMLVAFIPIVGGIWLIVLLATDGDSGDNSYGKDPKGDFLDEDSSVLDSNL